MSLTDRTRHPLTVLVVDDSIDTADSLAELLRLHGHAVMVAYSGESALQSAAARVPDVVFLDILMPDLNGCQVAELIRNRCAACGKRPILVAITGCGTEEDRKRSARAGFDLHLVKPVDPAVLVGMLERFRRLLAPPIPVDQLDPSPEDRPDAPMAMAPHYPNWTAIRG